MNIGSWATGDVFALGAAFSLSRQIGGYSVGSADINSPVAELTF